MCVCDIVCIPAHVNIVSLLTYLLTYMYGADAKVCGGAAPLRIDEIAYNAVAVVWNTRDRRVKV